MDSSEGVRATGLLIQD